MKNHILSKLESLTGMVSTLVLLLVLVLAAVLTLSSSLPQARAMEDFDDESGVSSSSRSQDSRRQRQYAGGRDEQEIQVQPTLPQPTRAPDGLTQTVQDSAAAAAADRD